MGAFESWFFESANEKNCVGISGRDVTLASDSKVFWLQQSMAFTISRTSRGPHHLVPGLLVAGLVFICKTSAKQWLRSHGSEKIFFWTPALAPPTENSQGSCTCTCDFPFVRTARAVLLPSKVDFNLQNACQTLINLFKTVQNKDFVLENIS